MTNKTNVMNWNNKTLTMVVIGLAVGFIWLYSQNRKSKAMQTTGE